LARLDAGKVEPDLEKCVAGRRCSRICFEHAPHATADTTKLYVRSRSSAARSDHAATAGSNAAAHGGGAAHISASEKSGAESRSACATLDRGSRRKIRRASSMSSSRLEGALARRPGHRAYDREEARDAAEPRDGSALGAWRRRGVHRCARPALRCGLLILAIASARVRTPSAR
jgi:hypothetical protein